ncbi:hypothetical protein [Actinopolymorpha alba]|uniref:hypothetical protein n=1 Tax=Actinopolymorpha alba TaxID=533267 RepID=UPI0012F65F10|nr:hypothetical protein [Actinopolymorpha alba]
MSATSESRHEVLEEAAHRHYAGCPECRLLSPCPDYQTLAERTKVAWRDTSAAYREVTNPRLRSLEVPDSAEAFGRAIAEIHEQRHDAADDYGA